MDARATKSSSPEVSKRDNRIVFLLVGYWEIVHVLVWGKFRAMNKHRWLLVLVSIDSGRCAGVVCKICRNTEISCVPARLSGEQADSVAPVAISCRAVTDGFSKKLRAGLLTE
jgi:hypothetical protein